MILRILIVEDDALIALDLAMTVEELGHEVVGEAAEAKEAVGAAGRLRPDLVLMDVKLLRGSSGFEAAREIHERFGIRSLFCSGNIDEDLKARASGVNPVGWLAKPISPNALSRVLDALSGASAAAI